MSGEAEARSNLDLPGRQEDLIDAIKATGVSNLRLSSHTMSRRGSIRASVDVTNTGSRGASEPARTLRVPG